MTNETEQLANERGGWRLAGLLMGVLLVVLLVEHYRGGRAPQDQTPDRRFSGEGAAGQVTLTMSREGEPLRTLELPIAGEVTLLDAMREASRRDPQWHVQFDGSGKGAFVAELGGVSNDASRGIYWLYELNGQEGDVGIGACTLTAGDDILWKFAPYD